MRQLSSLAFIAALVLSACGSAATPPAPRLPVAAPVTVAAPAASSTEALPDGTAPRPFTAEQIRAAMPVGHLLRLRMEAPGAEPQEQRWEVTSADATHCTIASKVYDQSGVLARDEGAGTSLWTELRDHAAFPAAETEITSGTIEVPAGRFDTRVYKVTSRDGVHTVVKTLHFATALPGPPVLMTVEQDGVLAMKMTLLERR